VSAHDVEALTELLDGELSPGRRKHVESHLSGCASCREELERLRGVSRAVRSLPEKPLPAGFLSRFERRRSPGRRAADRRVPRSALAFALASLLMVVFIADRAKVMLSLNDTGLASDASRLPSPALTEEDVERSRELKPSKKLAAAPGVPLDAITMAGASTPLRVGPSNEELHADLEKQKRKMGIRRIAAKTPATDDWRKMAQDEAESLAGAMPPAPKIGGAAPADLKQPQEVAPGKPLPGPERGAPVAAEADAPAAPSGPAEGLVVRSEEERQKIWTERGMHMRPPTVRYDRSVIVLVVAPDMRSAVEVLGVDTRAQGVVVRYRLFPRIADIADSSAAPVKSYQFRVIPKTDKPVTFERVDN